MYCADEHGEGYRSSPRANTVPPPPNIRGSQYLQLLLEYGAYKRSPAECLAPFFRDRTQRIAALVTHNLSYLVFPVEALLRLARSREGGEIEWDEWKIHVDIPLFVGCACWPRVWISGCRLFSLTFQEKGKLEMYDFSVRGRTKYLRGQADADLGGVRYLASTGVNAWLPWGIDGLFNVNGGHDSIAFLCVRVLLFSCGMILSDVVQMPDRPPEDDKGVLHMWSF